MQNTVLIYRIEDDKLDGPYGGYNSLSANQDSKRHPGPYNDSALVADFEYYYNAPKPVNFHIPAHYRFGFSNIPQLRAWIYDDDWLIDLHARGYHLSIYELERSAVAIGYSQAMFNKDKATLLRTQSILEAFNITMKEKAK